MEVILLEKIQKLGDLGQQVQVKPGCSQIRGPQGRTGEGTG
jgi:ribosomal protein L9